VDHSHGPESTISDEADSLYRPLSGLDRWAAAPVDHAAWAEALERLDTLRRQDNDWGDMVARGAMLAAAYQSGALDGVHPADPAVAPALVRGQASVASMDPDVRAHVRANVDALVLARSAAVSEETIRRIHDVACRPQLTHRVLVDGRAQDHVMAHGDYKHHPNHRLTPAGDWLATAPVAQVEPEMARLVALAQSPEFAALHPVAQASWLQHALLHVQPFADGNGRVARALGGGCLLRAASIPLVVFDDHHDVDVLQAVVRLVDVMEAADPGAVVAWRERSAAADALRRQVMPALERSLRRPDPARRADVSAATVAADLVVRVPGVEVGEVFLLDAQPLDGGPPTITAREAGLRLQAGDPIEPWADRIASVLALRVAAEME